jgi:hypothetical protein
MKKVALEEEKKMMKVAFEWNVVLGLKKMVKVALEGKAVNVVNCCLQALHTV